METLKTTIEFVGNGSGGGAQEVGSNIAATGDLLFIVCVIAAILSIAGLAFMLIEKKMIFVGTQNAAYIKKVDKISNNRKILTIVIAAVMIISIFGIVGLQNAHKAMADNAPAGSVPEKIKAVVDDNGKVTIDNSYIVSPQAGSSLLFNAINLSKSSDDDNCNWTLTCDGQTIYNAKADQKQTFDKPIIVTDKKSEIKINTNMNAQSAKNLIGKSPISIEYFVQQSSKLSGQVVDFNKTPLPNILVTYKGPSSANATNAFETETTTNINGNYEMQIPLEQGTGTLTFTDNSGNLVGKAMLIDASKPDQQVDLEIMYKKAEPPTVHEKLKYTGVKQIGVDFDKNTIEHVSGIYESTDPGSYVTSLQPKQNYAWTDDGTTVPRVYFWEITGYGVTLNPNGGTVSKAPTDWIKSGDTYTKEYGKQPIEAQVRADLEGFIITKTDYKLDSYTITLEENAGSADANWVEAPSSLKAVYDTSDDANVLTFYYDNQPHNGNNSTVYPAESIPLNATSYVDWPYHDLRAQIKEVIIDSTMKDFKDFKSTAYMCAYIDNATNIEGFEHLYTANVENMDSMFKSFAYDTIEFNKVPDVSLWNTASLENIDGMFFQYADKSKRLTLVPDVAYKGNSVWDTQHIVNMNCTFGEYNSLGGSDVQGFPDVSNWDTRACENTHQMFESYAGFNNNIKYYTLDLSNFDTSKITDCIDMFAPWRGEQEVVSHFITIGPKWNLNFNDCTLDLGYLQWYNKATGDGPYECSEIPVPVSEITTYTDIYPIQDYMTINIDNDVEDNGTVAINKKVLQEPYGSVPNIEYRTLTPDSGKWTEWTTVDPEDWVFGDQPISGYHYIINNIAPGSMLQFKGDNLDGFAKDNVNMSFYANRKHTVSGNVMSLVYGDDTTHIDTIPADACFMGLFAGDNYLTSVGKNFLPATNLTNSCYSDMFNMFYNGQGDQSLLESLPAELLPPFELKDKCYYQMFYACKNLTNVPTDLIKGVKMAPECCYGMFNSCVSMTTAPNLNVITRYLAKDCYKEMFLNCTSLNKINVSFDAFPKSGTTYTSTDRWMENVATTGTFTGAGHYNESDYSNTSAIPWAMPSSAISPDNTFDSQQTQNVPNWYIWKFDKVETATGAYGVLKAIDPAGKDTSYQFVATNPFSGEEGETFNAKLIKADSSEITITDDMEVNTPGTISCWYKTAPITKTVTWNVDTDNPPEWTQGFISDWAKDDETVQVVASGEEAMIGTTPEYARLPLYNKSLSVFFSATPLDQCCFRILKNNHKNIVKVEIDAWDPWQMSPTLVLQDAGGSQVGEITFYDDQVQTCVFEGEWDSSSLSFNFSNGIFGLCVGQIKVTYSD